MSTIERSRPGWVNWADALEEFHHPATPPRTSEERALGTDWWECGAATVVGAKWLSRFHSAGAGENGLSAIIQKMSI